MMSLVSFVGLQEKTIGLRWHLKAFTNTLAIERELEKET